MAGGSQAHRDCTQWAWGRGPGSASSARERVKPAHIPGVSPELLSVPSLIWSPWPLHGSPGLPWGEAWMGEIRMPFMLSFTFAFNLRWGGQSLA